MEVNLDEELFPGGAYPRADREVHRRKKIDFWTGVNGIGEGVAVMMEWERSFGTALDSIKPFLKLTGDAVEYIACPGDSNCGCAHYVSETRLGEMVATCQCTGDWRCGEYQLEPEDVLLHGVDWHMLGDAVGRGLGFAEPSAAPYITPGLREIGSYASVAAPVYMGLSGGQALVRDLIRLQGLREGPFLLLTATGKSWTPEVETLARPHGGGHVSLSSVLIPAGAQFRAVAALEPMLAEFARRLGKGKGLASVVQQINNNLQAIAKGSAELRRENEELKEMQGAGLFKFALRVAVEDFQAFAAVMALGNRKAAADFLDIPLRTFYDRVDSWKARGKDYQRMFRMVEWRKATGRKIQVRLEDSLMSSDGSDAENPETLGSVLARMREQGSDSRSFPDVLRQVWQALQEQNAGNWSGVRDELVEMLSDEVPQ